MSGAGANMVLGAVNFSPALSCEDRMAASIIRLECENDELRARVAVLEEERNILAERFDARLDGAGKTAEAKAAVIEGGAGYSGVERPEPSPQFKQPAQDALADAESYPQTLSCVSWATDVSGWPTYLVVNALVAQKLERERDEAREALRDMLSGWKYIRQVHGDLYGVGWDRAQSKAEKALEAAK